MKPTTHTWLEFVRRDLEAAKQLLPTPYLANTVLYHCQQAVEKALKAILEEHELDIPKTHNISQLYHLLPSEAQQAVSLTKDEMMELEKIYIDARYPGEQGLLPDAFPTQIHAEEVFIVTERVVQQVFRYLNVQNNEEMGSGV